MDDLDLEIIDDIDVIDVSDGPNCVVCTTAFEDLQAVTVGMCGHFCCQKCFDSWSRETATSDGSVRCPLCRGCIDVVTLGLARVFRDAQVQTATSG